MGSIFPVVETLNGNHEKMAKAQGLFLLFLIHYYKEQHPHFGQSK